jgi:Glucosyl transferase GtrII
MDDRGAWNRQPNQGWRWAAILAPLVFVLINYSHLITGMVGYGDDYWLLWEPEPVLDVWNKAGRWASGLYFRVVWSRVDLVEELWFPRALAVFGVALFASLLCETLRRLKYSLVFAAAFSVLASLLPTFAVYSVWATCSGHIYACLAALAAFLVVEKAASRWTESIRDKPTTEAPTLRLAFAKSYFVVLAWILASALLLFVAFSIYQPAAMFFVTLSIMSLASDRATQIDASERTRWWMQSIVLILAMGANFVTFRLMTGEVAGIDMAARATFTTDYITKAGRFVLQPLGQSTAPFLFVNEWTKAPMFLYTLFVLGLFVPIGMWFRLRGSAKTRIVRIVLLMILIPVTYVPNLVVASDFYPHRTRPAIAVAILFLMVMALSGFVRRIIEHNDLRLRFVSISAVIACIVASALTQYHLRVFFLQPAKTEWELICSEVQHELTYQNPTPTQIRFAVSDSDRPIAPRFVYDEFGYLTSSAWWVCKGMTGGAIKSIAPESLHAFEQAEFVTIPRDAELPEAEYDKWLINARKLHDKSE